MWPLKSLAGPVRFVAGVNHVLLPLMKGGCHVTKNLDTVSDLSFLLDDAWNCSIGRHITLTLYATDKQTKRHSK